MERHLRTQEEITAYLQAAAKAAGERCDHTILLQAIGTAAKPRFETIMKVLDALGLQISLIPKTAQKAEHA